MGSDGTLTISKAFKPGLNASIRLYREEKSETIRIPSQELYIGEVEDMADCILLGKAPRISLSDSRANTAAIVALLQSAAANRPVSL